MKNEIEVIDYHKESDNDVAKLEKKLEIAQLEKRVAELERDDVIRDAKIKDLTTNNLILKARLRAGV